MLLWFLPLLQCRSECAVDDSCYDTDCPQYAADDAKYETGCPDAFRIAFVLCRNGQDQADQAADSAAYQTCDSQDQGCDCLAVCRLLTVGSCCRIGCIVSGIVALLAAGELISAVLCRIIAVLVLLTGIAVLVASGLICTAVLIRLLCSFFLLCILSLLCCISVVILTADILALLCVLLILSILCILLILSGALFVVMIHGASGRLALLRLFWLLRCRVVCIIVVHVVIFIHSTTFLS